MQYFSLTSQSPRWWHGKFWFEQGLTWAPECNLQSQTWYTDVPLYRSDWSWWTLQYWEGDYGHKYGSKAFQWFNIALPWRRGACHSLKKKHKFLTVQLSRVLIKHIFCVNMFQTPHPQFIIQALMTSSGLFSQINSKQIHLQTWNWCSDPLNVLNANKNPHEDLTVFKMKIWTFFNWNLNWI